MSQTIDTFDNQMSDSKVVTEDQIKGEDMSSDEPDPKRLKAEDNNSLSEVVKEVLTDEKPKFKREKLRKWVLLLSYCGQNYYGMQRQTQLGLSTDHKSH